MFQLFRTNYLSNKLIVVREFYPNQLQNLVGFVINKALSNGSYIIYSFEMHLKYLVIHHCIPSPTIVLKKILS